MEKINSTLFAVVATTLFALVAPVYLTNVQPVYTSFVETVQPKTLNVIREIPNDEPTLFQAPSITCDDVRSMLIARGTVGNQLDAAMEVIQKESSCNPNAVNPISGAFGLCQALPAEKMATAGEDYRTNPETQLAWCDSYAKRRYRGWIGAAIQQRRFGWF